MNEKISSETRERAPRHAARGESVPVIVTTVAGASLGALERRGFAVRQAWESISAVAGTVPAEMLDDLAALDEVLLIEHDGEVYPLE